MGEEKMEGSTFCVFFSVHVGDENKTQKATCVKKGEGLFPCDGGRGRGAWTPQCTQKEAGNALPHRLNFQRQYMTYVRVLLVEDMIIENGIVDWDWDLNRLCWFGFLGGVDS